MSAVGLVSELSRERNLFLTLNAGTVERPISEPAVLSLSAGPRRLELVVLWVHTWLLAMTRGSDFL